MFLPRESQGWQSLVGCHLWGRTESDTTEATWQQQQHTPLFKSFQHFLVIYMVNGFDIVNKEVDVF